MLCAYAGVGQSLKPQDPNVVKKFNEKKKVYSWNFLLFKGAKFQI